MATELGHAVQENTRLEKELSETRARGSKHSSHVQPVTCDPGVRHALPPSVIVQALVRLLTCISF